MTASSVFKFLGRIVMLGAFIMAAWFVFSMKRPDSGAEKEKQAETENNRLESEGKGEMPNPKDGMGGEKIIPENFQQPEIPASSSPAQSGNSRHLRTLQVIHLHLPDDASSRALSDSLAEIRMSWPDHLTISTLDVSSKPQALTTWRVSRAPAVVFQTEGQRLYAMEELWPKDRLAKKIEALIHGLVQVDKNWRPEVKGLEPR